MASNVDRVEVWQGADRQWYWHAKAANNETVAEGEGYVNKSDLLDQVFRLFGDDVRILEL